MSDLPIFEDLFQRRVGAIKPGLERMHAIKAILANHIDREVTRIIVAGTNGKGTTAGFLWQLLTNAGKRVGLYTSPHIHHFRERFVTDQVISDDDIAECLEFLRIQLSEDLWEELSFFEITTALSWLVFARAEVEYEIYEVGLGGRWDATNTLDADLAILVSVGLDHQEYLGDTVEQIAREKCGVFRPGQKVVLGDFSGELAKTIAEELPADCQVKTFSDESLRTDLPNYLAHNYQLACLAAEHLSVPPPPEGEMLPQLPSLAGRYQRQSFGQREGLVDVCHNVAGAKVLLEQLQKDYPTTVPTIALTMMADKDNAGVIKTLKRSGAEVVGFANNHPRGWQATDISEHGLQVYEDFQSFLANTSGDFIVAGSVMGLADVLHTPERRV